jgi:hypothetical protein
LGRPKKKPPMSLRAYAARRGVTAMAVSKAIKSGRLAKSVVRDASGDPKIADADLADREWDRSTDLSKAPGYVKERASSRAPAAQRPPLRAVPPADDAGGGADGPGPEELNLSQETAREKHWKANKAEIEYREKLGQLVDAQDLKGQISDAFTRVRSRLAGLPTRVRQQIPHLTAEEVGIIDDFVREALDELALKLESEDDDDDGDGS